jgi:hypothetical protein
MLTALDRYELGRENSRFSDSYVSSVEERATVPGFLGPVILGVEEHTATVLFNAGPGDIDGVNVIKHVNPVDMKIAFPVHEAMAAVNVSTILRLFGAKNNHPQGRVDGGSRRSVWSSAAIEVGFPIDDLLNNAVHTLIFCRRVIFEIGDKPDAGSVAESDRRADENGPYGIVPLPLESPANVGQPPKDRNGAQGNGERAYSGVGDPRLDLADPAATQEVRNCEHGDAIGQGDIAKGFKGNFGNTLGVGHRSTPWFFIAAIGHAAADLKALFDLWQAMSASVMPFLRGDHLRSAP